VDYPFLAPEVKGSNSQAILFYRINNMKFEKLDAEIQSWSKIEGPELDWNDDLFDSFEELKRKARDEILQKFETDDWLKLGKSWEQRSRLWQLHFVEIVERSDPIALKPFIPILLEDLSSDPNIRHMGTIRYFLKGVPVEDSAWELSPNLLERLIDYSKEAKGYNATFVKDVLQQVRPRC
jgi:hypothetical protein